MDGEVEGSPCVHHRFRPYPSGVPVEDALHNSQTNPSALEILCPMQSLENAEQFRGVAHVEADAVVAHPVHALTIFKLMADAHQGVDTLLTVLHGVLDK